MTLAAVNATTINALGGLYLTPDMWYSAAYLTPSLLDACVQRMHERQPLTTDFEWFAERASESYHLWSRGASNEPRAGAWELRLGHLHMAGADLAITYPHILRGLLAASDQVLAILLRTMNVADDAQYPRVIPAALDDLRITAPEQIDVGTYWRVLTTEPWLSWLERLRAQKQRTSTLLTSSGLEYWREVGRVFADLPADDPERPTMPRRLRRPLHRSVRKSAAMFDRVLGHEALRKFLHSRLDDPLIIKGHAYDYHLVMRPRSLIRTTIDPNTRTATVATMVYNKAGVRLCELCHYFDDTPALDCVIATALHVRNPETELDLLRAAYILDAPAGFYTDPVLPELKNLYDPATAPTLVESVFNHADTLSEEQHALRDALRRQITPALVAFREINHVGKDYLPMMRMAGLTPFEDYMLGDVSALACVELVRNKVAEGLSVY